MRHFGSFRISAAMILAAAMAALGTGSVMAQGEEDSTEVVEAEAETDAAEEAEPVPVDDCELEEDCTEQPDADTAPVIADAEPAAGAGQSDGAVLATPGATDESNPGGSTKPGTTPDD